MDDVSGDIGYITAPGPFGAVSLLHYVVGGVSDGVKLYKYFKNLSPEDEDVLEALPWE